MRTRTRCMMKAVGALIGMCLCMLGSAEADVISVRPDGTGEFPTIQAAIAAASDGDVIELEDGVYQGDGNRNIEFFGKAITVRSASGDPDYCIVDCEEPGNRGFLFRSNESPATVVADIAIINGSPPGFMGYDGGGAIRCNPDASPTILNCVFRDNEALGGEPFWPWEGGAIAAYADPGPALIDCRFYGNAAQRGAAIFGRFAIVQNCTFIGNEGAGTGTVVLDSNVNMEGCTVAWNEGAGVFASLGSGAGAIQRSIIAFNEGEAFDCDASAEITFTCCDLFSNSGGDWTNAIAGQLGIRGNLCLDPLFCGLETMDVELQSNSPCAPDYNPDCGLIGAWPVGCHGSPVVGASWGALKAKFR